MAYAIPEFEGLPIRQKNYRAYLTHDHAWIDIHISKVDATAKDEARVKKLLKSVRIEEKRKTPPHLAGRAGGISQGE